MQIIYGGEGYKMARANAVVGQSGGPTGVINASLVGVIEEAQDERVGAHKRHSGIARPCYGGVSCFGAL